MNNESTDKDTKLMGSEEHHQDPLHQFDSLLQGPSGSDNLLATRQSIGTCDFIARSNPTGF